MGAKADSREVLERYTAGDRDFSGLRLLNGDFSGKSLVGASFAGAIARKACFSNCDLRAADFTGADLTNADFRGANLEGATLVDADASGARLESASARAVRFEGARLRKGNLEKANFSRASGINADLENAQLPLARFERAVLTGANMQRCDLSGTSFRMADLSEVTLKGAFLRNTEFSGADLSGANILNATFGGIIFGRTRLERVVGFESLRHESPSMLDTVTLGMSKGRLPNAFLRGCGLLDWEIELAKLHDPARGEEERTEILYRVFDGLGSQAIQYESVFISHSTADQAFADKLFERLQDAGVRCWYAPRHLKGGRKVFDQIGGAIQIHDRLLLVLSESSMTSDWVQTEIAEARAKEAASNQRVLFPITLVPFEDIRKWKLFDADRGSDSARAIREYFIPDFSKWSEEPSFDSGFERLLRDLVPDRPSVLRKLRGQ